MNKIRFISFLTLIMLISILFTLTSCPPPEEEKHEFKDQVLQGKIGGENWVFVSGTAEDIFDEDELWIDLYDIEPDGGNPWALGAYLEAEDKVMFIIDEEEGYISLNNTQTVTLLDKPEGMNNICIVGAVEILSLDAENELLTGRMYAYFDDDNTVEGNFTVAYLSSSSI